MARVPRRRLRLPLLGALVAATLVFTSVPAGAAGETPPASIWLTYINYYRATAALPAVSENTTYDAGDRNHAVYMVKNNTVTHNEDPANPYYTSNGAAAGPKSVLFGSASTNGYSSDQDAIDFLMQTPFHALGIIDPGNRQVGYGADREPMAFPKLNTGVAIDVQSGRGAIPAGVTFPVKWPRGGSSVPISRYPGNESPDPLAFCAGYTAPAGLPILFMAGSGSSPPAVTAASVSKAGTKLPVCRLDQTNTTGLAQQILAQRNAVVLIPKSPLAAGAYAVSITNHAKVYSWTFNVVTNRLAVSLKTPTTTGQPVVATFSQAVHGVTTSNFVIRKQGTTANLVGTLTCYDVAAAVTSCATGSVATAQLKVTTVSGQSYTTIVDPAGVTPVQNDSAAAVPQTTANFKVT
jgi:cysteine-rich secretory family protein